MAKYISSSLGNIIPNVSGAYTQNPGYFGGPYAIGSITCGEDNYSIEQTRSMGSNIVRITKNGVTSSYYPNGNMDTSGSVGFYATMTSSTVKVYYIWTDGDPTVTVDTQETITAQAGQNYSYGATLLGEYDSSILIDDGGFDPPDHPDFNPDYDPNVSQGGENADTESITTDEIINWDSFPYDPESVITSHDHIRMMQPYLLTASDWITMGEIFWKDVDQQTSFFQRLKELFSNGATDPLSAIAGFIRLPLSASAISTSGSGNVFLGGLEVTDGTKHVVGDYINNRYTRLGYMIDIKESFGTYFDYVHTKCSLYLPYCTQIELSAQEVMGGKVYANYTIDVYTGDLVCTVVLDKMNYGRHMNAVIGRYKGNCAMPVFYSRGNTQQNTQNIFNGAMNYASAIASDNLLGGLSTLGNTLAGQRIRTEKGGSISGASGWFDVQYPYIIFQRDIPIYPEGWRSVEGAEQNATFTVGSLSGFTKFDSIHVEIPSATDEENAEIETYLKNGIII